MNILVTGASGQLGLCIRELAQTISTCNFFYKDSTELDISNAADVNNFFSENTIDYCINCAAYTAVDKAEEDTEKAYRVNVLGSENLAKASKASNAVLIHVSTDFVFDGSSNEAYVETNKTNPLNVYGQTKLEGEQKIKDHLEYHFIIRTSWLYSEYGNNFLKTMLRLGSERDTINIVSDQIGTPTYAKDLATIILKIIKTQSKAYGIYHYSNHGVSSWYNFAVAIFELSKTKIEVNPIPTKDYPTPAKRPYFSVLDKTKIKKTFNLTIPEWMDSLKVAIANL